MIKSELHAQEDDRSGLYYEFNEDYIEEMLDLGEIDRLILTISVWEELYDFFPLN